MSSFAEDDDGIIDLHALSTRTPNKQAAAPLFSEPPPAFVSDATPRPSGGGTGVVIAAIACVLVVVLALAGVGLRYAFRAPEPIARKGVTVQTPAPPPTQAPVAASPAPAADPAPPSTASDDDGKPSRAATKKKGIRGTHRTFASSDVKKEPVTRPARAADPCGCHGNFDCNLRCAAGQK